MIRTIRNFRELDTSPLRHDALSIVEAGFQAIDTKTILKNSLRIDGDTLTIQGEQFLLTSYRHIYIIGFGKVSCKAAYVLEEMLKGKVKEGAVVGIKEVTCQIVDTYAGTHPVPSHLNFTATRHIEEIARKATGDDLVLVVVSGGGSALLCSSLEECDQGQKLYDMFLRTEGTIEELNVVRRHISKLKGGGLAQVLYPATVVSLIFSDVPGGDIESIASGPTVKSTSSIAEAQAIIDRYRLGDFRLYETPTEEKYFERVHNYLVASNITALEAMQKEALSRGYTASIISSEVYANFEGTRDLFDAHARSAQVLCMGGETKMMVPLGATGKGGRNTHLALCMLRTLQENEVFVSFASDGKDNTDAAGALVDVQIQRRMEELFLDLEGYKHNCDSYTFFKQTGGLLFTTPLESNVADLMLLLRASTDTV